VSTVYDRGTVDGICACQKGSTAQLKLTWGLCPSLISLLGVYVQALGSLPDVQVLLLRSVRILSIDTTRFALPKARIRVRRFSEEPSMQVQDASTTLGLLFVAMGLGALLEPFIHEGPMKDHEGPQQRAQRC